MFFKRLITQVFGKAKTPQAEINSSDMLVLAEAALSSKSWAKAVEYYERLLVLFPEQAPVTYYSKIAIARRMMREYGASEEILKNGFDRFPNNHILIIEYAALENARENWFDAKKWWEKAKCTKKKFSALNYNRYAKACEMVDDWALHERLVSEGLANHPADRNLFKRFIFSIAQKDAGGRDYKSAIDKFKILQSIRKVESLPFAINYYRRLSEMRVQLESSCVKNSDLVIFNNIKLEASVFPGLTEQLICSAKDKSEWSSFLSVYQEVLSFVAKVDSPLNASTNPCLLEVIRNLASSLPLDLEIELSRDAWLVLSGIYIVGRCFFAYKRVRDKAVSVSVESPVEEIKNLSDLRYSMAAACEIEQDSRQLQLAPVVKSYEAQDTLFIYSLFLYSGGLANYRAGTSRYFTECEKAFSEYIKNKRVAIVGPVAVGANNGAEIDSYDVVVRFNFKGLNKFDPLVFGTKTNVSFYISQDLPTDVVHHAKVKVMNGLDWIVCDYNQNAMSKCFEGLKSPIRPRFKAGHDFVNPFFKGTANAVQRCLLDLLRFPCASIKVFNSNLFLDGNYSPGYRTEASVANYNFMRHDPVSNFIFLQRLRAHNLVEVDEVLGRVLEVDADGYVAELNARYGATGGS